MATFIAARQSGCTETLQYVLAIMYPRIIIILKHEDNSELMFDIKMHTELRKVYAAFCEFKALSIDSVRFLFNGGPIPPDSTAETLGLVGGDEILAMMEPVGN